MNASPGGIQKMHGGKAELSTTTISGMYFRCKSQMEKIEVIAQGGGFMDQIRVLAQEGGFRLSGGS